MGIKPICGSPDAWADARASTSGVTVPESIVRLTRVFLVDEADANAAFFCSTESGPPQEGITLQQDDNPREQIVRINKYKVTFIVNIIL